MLRTAVILAVALLPILAAAEPSPHPSVLFLHHSCGRNLVRQGAVRELLTRAGVAFWDHDYNREGSALTDPQGQPAGCYWIPDNNLWADGYAALFAMHGGPADSPFARITANHDVILFKSCYPASDILADDDAKDRADPASKSLANYRRHYLAIRDTVDKMPNRTFVIVTQPPLHPRATTPENATRARAFAEWIGSDEYLGNRPNLFVFDFFDLLADPRTHVLREEYHNSPNRDDSHPNALANAICGPLFADFIANLVGRGRDGGPAVTMDQAPGPDIFLAVDEAHITLSGAATDPSGIARIAWTDLRGGGGELPAAEAWQTPVLPLALGANRFVVTVHNREGLRSSAATVVRRLTRKPVEISLFSDSLSGGSLRRCTVSADSSGNRGRHLAIDGTGEWLSAGILELDIDIAGIDSESAYLQFRLDRGSESSDYVGCGAGVGSQLIHPDSRPGYETFVIPFRNFRYLEDRITSFRIGATWQAGARIRVDDVRIIDPATTPERGLASGFPLDRGLASHPSVLLFLDFDDGDETAAWIGDHEGYAWTGDPAHIFAGAGALEMQQTAGTHQPHEIHPPLPPTDVAFVRFYRRYPAGYDFTQHKMPGVYAYADGHRGGGAGQVPDGYDKYSCKLFVNFDGYPRFYSYHPEQRGPWGDAPPMNLVEEFALQTERWYCMEMMIRANDPPASNGELMMWIDGRRVAHYQGMRFRDTPDLRLNVFTHSAYVGGNWVSERDQQLWDDQIVVATQYIGPMASHPPPSR